MIQLGFLPGLSALLFIPVLILIHSLRHKPVQKGTTTLFIWEQVIQEQKRAIFFAKVLENLSLLLQIAAIICIAVALCRPSIFLSSDRGKRDVLVIDTSASMQTRTNGTTRFAKAIAHARQKIEAMNPEDQMMIVSAGTKPQIEQHFTGSKAELLNILSQISTRDGASDMKKAVYLGLSFIKSAEAVSRIFLITDGTGFDLQSLINLSPSVTPVLVSGGEKNYALTAFEFRQLPGRKNTYDIMVRVKNFSKNPVVCPLILKASNHIIRELKVGLDANQAKTKIIPFKGKIENYIEAGIMLQDDLDADNRAWAVLQPEKKTNIFLVTKGNFFLEKVLGAFDDFQVTTSFSVPQSSWDAIVERNDVVILDSIEPPRLNNGNFILINTLHADLPVRNNGLLEKPVVSGWRKDAPVMAGLNPDRLFIASAMDLRLENDTGSLSVLNAGATSLISQIYGDRFKAVLIGFDIGASDLPLRVAFPVLMKNAVHWLHPKESVFVSSSIKAGTPIRLNIKNDRTRVLVRDPSGKWNRQEADKGVYEYTETARAGIYKIKKGTLNHFVAVNMLDEAESDIFGVPDLKSADSRNHETERSKKDVHRTDVWPFFLICVLLLWTAETWLRMKKESM